MQQLVISAAGPDQPGIVDRLTQPLVNYGANIADSRMVNLRGQFALVMLIQAPDEKAPALRQALADQAQAIGLTAVVSLPTPPGSSGTPAPGATAQGVPYRIRTYAMDQAGLVHRITHLLHLHRCNIEELQTRLEQGAYTGTPVFSMDLVVTLPPNVPLKKVRQELEALCDSLNCDLDIQPA